MEHPTRMEVLVETAHKDAVDLLARQRNISRNDVMREALDQYLKAER
jgi:predicted transcriptional regulator